MNNNTNLSFGDGNAKLSKTISTFSLPAGHSCPFAKECLSKANRLTGKVIDGQHCRFRCFAASQEVTYPSVRRARWHNFDMLKNSKGIKGMAEVIQKSLPIKNDIIRIHVSGDYFNETYFLAWLNVAIANPLKTFYGYTKALPFVVAFRKHIPFNLRLTASKGGTHDELINRYKLKFAEVVFSVNEAKEKGLAIDHDDSHAIANNKSFALLLHGIQPAGSAASLAKRENDKLGFTGYGANGAGGFTNKPNSVSIVVGPEMKFKFKPKKQYAGK